MVTHLCNCFLRIGSLLYATRIALGLRVYRPHLKRLQAVSLKRLPVI